MVVVDQGKCDVCGTCISVCPFGALLLTDTLQVDSTACRSCYRCVRVCPVGALEHEKNTRAAETAVGSKEVANGE